MKMLIIAAKDVKLRLKDRKAIILMLLMPLLLTAILGSALKGAMGDSDLPKTTIGIYAADEDALTETFIHEVLLDEMKESVTVKQTKSSEELQKWVKDSQVDVGVMIPSNWGENLGDHSGNPVLIYPANGKDFETAFVQQLTESYAQTAQTIAFSTKEVMATIAVTAASNGAAFQPEALQNELIKNMEKATSLQQDAVKNEPTGEQNVSSMQYYAAAMAAMFLLFNAMNGGKAFHQERSTETLARLMMTQASNTSILLGKFLGTLFFAFLQFMIFMSATYFVLNVSWGDNIPQTIFIAFIYSFAVSGLSMVVAAFTSSEKAADTIGGIGVQLFAFLGGSMLPVSVFPSVMKKISMITPNSWALTSFTNIMSGTNWVTLMAPTIILALIGIVSLCIGTLLLRHKAL